MWEVCSDLVRCVRMVHHAIPDRVISTSLEVIKCTKPARYH